MIGSIAAGALVVLQVLIGRSVGGVSLDPTIWSWFALLCGAGFAVGGFLQFQESGSNSPPSSPPVA